ncbi:unnamed protein product [Paramecium octaurelia]|uniref:Uncharacterized protein n=1 Tax=Paramecium octaurelia TaxID=43137 RepID=A0A8S1Y6A7_PAROT|nr:unnamed protein product [Paramecium octaurelia]
MNTCTINKKTDSEKLSWSNLRKKIIKKYPQYKVIIDSNSNLFSKLDFSKKENQVKVINKIIEKQQQALELIFTEELENSQKEQQKQIQKLVGIIAKQSKTKATKQEELKKIGQQKGNLKPNVTAPVKMQLQKKVSDKIEAWNTLDDTQSLIHDYQDGTQDQFYITQDVQAPQENEYRKSGSTQFVPQSILTKKKKKQKKAKVSTVKEKSVRFSEKISQNEKNIDKNKFLKEALENEELDKNQGQNGNSDEEENVESNEENTQIENAHLEDDVDDDDEIEDNNEESQNENDEEEEDEDNEEDDIEDDVEENGEEEEQEEEEEDEVEDEDDDDDEEQEEEEDQEEEQVDEDADDDVDEDDQDEEIEENENSNEENDIQSKDYENKKNSRDLTKKIF